jgi:hypothetical protein
VRSVLPDLFLKLTAAMSVRDEYLLDTHVVGLES